MPDVTEHGRIAYQFSLADKVEGALGSLRIRLFPRHILIAGPFVGEFGHELMDWQAWVRAQVERYDEVHVITYPGREPLYPGCHVHTHQVLLEKAGYRYGRMTPAEWKAMAHAKAVELGLKNYDLLTALNLCTQYHKKYLLPSKYELLADPKAPSYDVAFHFRRLKKEGPDQSRNYLPELCDQVARACLESGHAVCCIGHPLYSYCPEGVIDLRSDDLQSSIDAISRVRLLAGELSGPMHLAQLCGIPILIWADGQWRIDNCKDWNVFKVPIFVVANDTHRPEVAAVVAAINNALESLRRGAINP